MAVDEVICAEPQNLSRLKSELLGSRSWPWSGLLEMNNVLACFWWIGHGSLLNFVFFSSSYSLHLPPSSSSSTQWVIVQFGWTRKHSGLHPFLRGEWGNLTIFYLLIWHNFLSSKLAGIIWDHFLPSASLGNDVLVAVLQIKCGQEYDSQDI